jgi:hypothetical protein
MEDFHESMEELDGIKELIIGYLVEKNDVKITELVNYLNLDEKIIWGAINLLRDEGKVFLPNDISVKIV